MLTKPTLGTRIRAVTGNHEFVGELVYQFPANRIPDPNIVKAFYGEEAPKGAYNAPKHDRLVLQKYNDLGELYNAYTIIADNGCWCFYEIE